LHADALDLSLNGSIITGIHLQVGLLYSLHGIITIILVNIGRRNFMSAWMRLKCHIISKVERVSYV